MTFKDLQIGSTVWGQSDIGIRSMVWSESSAIIKQAASDLLIKIQQTLPAESEKRQTLSAQLSWSHSSV